MDCQLQFTGQTNGDQREYLCAACGRPWWSTWPAKHLHRECGGLRVAMAGRGPCVHRRDETRRESCQTCQGNVRLKVFGCALHGECTLEKPLPGLSCCAVCPDRQGPLRLLLSARHGLGDSVQLSVVLAHLRHYHPTAQIELSVPPNRATAYRHQVAAVHTDGREKDPRFARQFDHVYELGWFEPRDAYPDCPSTKAEKCLKEVFKLEPIEALCRRYTLHVSDAARAKARDYLATLPKRAALLHYQGTSSKEAKDLTHADAEWFCRYLRDDFQLTPVVLDWDGACPFVDQKTVFRWDGSQGMPRDPEVLAALISESAIFLGIDSGPLHVAAATDTPSIGLWHGFHPVHYLCPAANVLNMVPPGHADLIRGDRVAGLAYFQRAYRYKVFHSFLSDTYDALADVLRNPGLVWRGNHWIRADNQEQDLTIARDVYEEDCYRLAELPIQREVIVDVGACLGSFAKRAYERNPTARIICVEAAPENISALHKNVGSFAEIVPAAVTYAHDVALLNAVYPGCASTGGSTVLARAEVERYAEGPQRRPGETIAGQKREYWADFRPLETVTLEGLAERFDFQTIDVLKLDCEGSEFSILENCNLSRIRRIVGEYHGAERFRDLLARRFAEDWTVEILRDGEIGLFRLTNHLTQGENP